MSKENTTPTSERTEGSTKQIAVVNQHGRYIPPNHPERTHFNGLAPCPDCGVLIAIRFPMHDCQIKPKSTHRFRGCVIQRLSDGKYGLTYQYSSKIAKRGFKTIAAAKSCITRGFNKLNKQLAKAEGNQ